MYYYFTYGLEIQSVIPFPELLEADLAASPRVSICLGNNDVPTKPLRPGGICYRINPHEIVLAWDNIGSIIIRNGIEIVLDIIPQTLPEVVRLCVLGPAIAVLLHQRKYLLLHASAVSIQDRAVAFLGMSGWGKSTMAVALIKRGHNLVADDIVAIKTQGVEVPLVYGGFPQMKIWPEIAANIDSNPNDLPKLRPDYEKRALRIPQNFQRDPIPLGGVYVLAEGNHPDPEIKPISPQAALIEFVRHSFVARLLERTGSMEHHFHQSSSIVSQVPVCRLRRRKSLPDLFKLAQRVEADALERITDLDG